jgi:hypothetical protein
MRRFTLLAASPAIDNYWSEIAAGKPGIPGKIEY